MWPIKTTLFFFGFVGACALSLVYPIVGIVNYMMLYMVNPDEMWWGRPLQPFNIRYSMMAGVCLILGMVINSTRLPRARTQLEPWQVLLVVFVLLVLMSGLVGYGSSSYSLNLMDKMVKMTVFMVCLTRMVSTLKNFRIVLWTLVVGTLMIGYDAYYAPDSDFFAGRLNFIGGPDFRDSSGLAAHMSAMLPLIAAALLIARHWRWRLLALVSGVLAVNTIIQCRTRSAFVGLVVGGAVAAIMAPRRRRGRVYIALIVGAIGAYSLTDEHFWERMSTLARSTATEDDDTIRSRMELWIVARRMIIDHPLGVGVGKFRDVVGQYEDDSLAFAFSVPKRVTHNTYLLCTTELGIQGLLVFASIVLISLLKIFNCSRLSGYCQNPAQVRLLSYGCLVSMVIYLSAAAFTDRLYTESYWWILALPVCLEMGVRREVAAVDELELEGALDDEYDWEDTIIGQPAGYARSALD